MWNVPLGCTTQKENTKTSPSFLLAEDKKFSLSHSSPMRNFSPTFTGFGQLSLQATL